MSNTIKFIDSIIRNIKSQEKRQTYWCYGCPGFGIRINPSGTKVFIFKYMSGEKKEKSRWISIGKYPALSIREARKIYDELYEQVHKFCRDPVAERKNEIQKQNNTYKVSEFVPVYLELEKLKEKASIKEEERIFNLDVIPVIGDIKLPDVTPDDIDKIQLRILKRAKKTKNAKRNGKVAVKNSLAYTRQLFNLAKDKKLIKTNPVAEVKSLGKAGSRDRVLNFEELWLFWNRIDKLVPPVTARALKFGIVTMQRSKEVRNMTYSSYKQNENVWHMQREDTKSKRMHRVPLNRYAHEIISEAQEYTGASPYIFGATRAKKTPKSLDAELIPYGKSALHQAVRRNRKALGIEDICPHDLRRTGATWITAVGLPKLYARLMLNHSDGDRDVTGEVYVQYSYDFEKQRAVKVWEFILDQIVTCKSINEIPTLDELRNRTHASGLL
ncbi:tyrosine-type recombinase/integrase [Aliikangiella sp. IMCC44359]|uniref:tyrosine-type recombinase/integrase n=1 Tax=Aliikangiella sp. IMCC44359 TaxID=3459125 RepID=UPI00403AA16A